MSFASHGERSTLPGRERELLILRTAYRCNCLYEWQQHLTIARQNGVHDDEIERISLQSFARWSEKDRLLLRAVDEMCELFEVSSPTWDELTRYWNQRSMMDIVFIVGLYVQTAIALKSLGVQIELSFDR
jgi:alkylhydroperoxidase family enzyme